MGVPLFDEEQKNLPKRLDEAKGLRIDRRPCFDALATSPKRACLHSRDVITPSRGMRHFQSDSALQIALNQLQ